MTEGKWKNSSESTSLSDDCSQIASEPKGGGASRVFTKFARDLLRDIHAGLVRLVVEREGQVIHDFSEPFQFTGISDWLLEQIQLRPSSLIPMEEIVSQCRSLDRFIYPYPFSWIGSRELAGGGCAYLAVGLKGEPVDANSLSTGLESFINSVLAKACLDWTKRDSLPFPLSRLVGESHPIRELKKRMLQIAEVDFTLLIEGESGTGKELVARGVHSLSRRASGPFIAVNAAAIPEHLLESELFGFRRGAFTGATESRIGLLEAANGGTLFLDEIADLPLTLQAKLLRVLQEREIRRLGENRAIPLDMRVISATHGRMQELVAAKKFREDLFYRLQDLNLRIPPLRERREDIPDLVRHFLRLHGNRSLEWKWVERLAACLRGRDFPGNVRELEAEVKRFLTFGGYVEQGNEGKEQEGTLKAERDRFERGYIVSSLHRHGWNRHQTAGELGISRMTLYNLMQKYRISEIDADPG